MNTEILSLHIWGDSILKGIVFNEQRGRYTILRENCVSMFTKRVPFPVINHARMGQTAPEAEADMRNRDPHPGGIALIEFGGNDCDMPWAEVASAPDAQHEPKTPPDLFERTLAAMVRHARSMDMRPILVVPTPLDAERYFQWVTKGLDQDAVLRYLGDIHHIYRWQEYYASIVADVASAEACPLLNMRRAFLEQLHLKPLLCVDGAHPSAMGHEVMLSCLERIVIL